MVLPAQFGLKGVALANVAIIVLTAFFGYKSAQALGSKYSWAVAIVTVLGNSVTFTVLAGLTEPLLMLSFAVVIYTSIVEKWKVMYTVLGASLLIRPEAVVLIPVFGLYGLYNGAWKSAFYGLIIPGLYTIGGVLVADYEWLWIFTRNSYPVESVYGHGNWNHYIHTWNKVAPWSTLIAAVIGMALVFKRKGKLVLVPIVVASFGILIVHIVIWRYGWMGSAGLQRTLSTVLPGFGLIGVLALERARIKVLVPLFVILVAFEWFDYNKVPVLPQRNEKVARLMADAMKERGYPNGENRIAYQFATTAFLLDIDPFEYSEAERLWSLDRENPTVNLSKGDIIIWDNLTGTREGDLPWERISNCANVQQLDSVTVRGATLVSFILTEDGPTTY